MTGEGAILNTSQLYTVKYVIISPSNLTCHITDNTFCCEACRLIQVAYLPAWIAYARSQASFEIFVCMYVYHRICLDFKFGPRNRGSFVRSQSIQKENKRTRRTQINCAVENFKLGRNPLSCRKPLFLQAASINASEGKKFP